MRPAINLDDVEDASVIKFLHALPHGSISQIARKLFNAAVTFANKDKANLGDLYVGTYEIVTTRPVDAPKRERKDQQDKRTEKPKG